MERLITAYNRTLETTTDKFSRYLYKNINWKNKLIVIIGARGTGKTTLILQHIKNDFNDTSKALYVSADNLWFSNHTLIDLVEHHYTHGGTHIFIDEIHKYEGWEREIKNIYDSYPNYNVVVTGSSALKIEDQMVADLSRRARVYTLAGMSFREYLELEGACKLPTLTLEEILTSHIKIATKIASKTKVLPYFERYVKSGFYPFYRDEGDGFYERLLRTLDTVIEGEIPSISDIEYATLRKAKHLLAILAENAPYTLNITKLQEKLTISRNSIVKLFDLLNRASIIRSIYATEMGMAQLVKPEKILFDNTNIMYALSPDADNGTMRETYFASQMSVAHKVFMPGKGDFVVDGKYLFEVGGKNKKFNQIKDIENSYVVADGIEIGFGNKIPLWLFGLTY